MSAAGQNLEAITAALDQHDRNCGKPAIQIRMTPFEVERLGWDEIRGVPIVADPKLGSGRFEIDCEHDLPAPAASTSERTEVVA